MDAEGAQDLQREEELAATPEDAAAAAVRAHVSDLHTALPGIIKAFDPVTQTAKVQPAIKRLWIEAGFLPLPELVDVPVQFPRGGGFALTFPVAAGDECLVVFSERAIDNWHHAGGVQEPSEYRLHDLSDGFAFLGFTSRPRALTPPPSGDAAELRTLDGATVVRVEAGVVVLGQAAGAEPAVKGDVLTAILELLKTHVHSGVTTGGGVSGTAPALAALPDPRATKVRVF